MLPILLATSSIALSSCSEDLPAIRYHTEKAVIGTSFSEPLCKGDLRFIDDQIVFIEDMLDVRAEVPIEIYLFNPDDIPCDTPFGCYDVQDDHIVTIWDFVDHELVHAVGKSMPFPSLFWEEGAAVALSVEGTHEHPRLVLDGPGIFANDDIDYSTAGHFVRWLMETRGIEPFVRVSNGEPLEAVYEATPDELAQAYESTAPYAYPAWEPCEVPEIPLVEEGRWREELTFSCESDEATHFEWAGASIVRRLSLEAGTYELSMTGGEGVLLVGCQTDVLTEPPPDWANGDVMNQAELFQTAFGTFFPANEVHTLSLTTGVYRLAISSGTDAVETVDVDVRRH